MPDKFLIPDNVAQAKIYGSDLSMSYKLTSYFSINFIGNFIKSKNKVTKEGLSSVSPYKVIAGINYSNEELYGVALDWTHSDKSKNIPMIDAGGKKIQGFIHQVIMYLI